MLRNHIKLSLSSYLNQTSAIRTGQVLSANDTLPDTELMRTIGKLQFYSSKLSFRDKTRYIYDCTTIIFWIGDNKFLLLFTEIQTTMSELINKKIL